MVAGLCAKVLHLEAANPQAIEWLALEGTGMRIIGRAGSFVLLCSNPKNELSNSSVCECVRVHVCVCKCQIHSFYFPVQIVV